MQVQNNKIKEKNHNYCLANYTYYSQKYCILQATHHSSYWLPMSGFYHLFNHPEYTKQGTDLKSSVKE